MIENILNKCGVAILVSVVALVVGVALGFQLKENKQGIYLTVKYPDGTPMFQLGKSVLQLSDVNLEKLEQNEILSLLSKLESLPVKSKLGNRLRRIALDGDGPFTPISISVNVHLLDEASVQGPIAKTCKNSPLYENPILMYGATSLDPQDSNIPVKGLLDIDVIGEHVSDCDSTESIPEIWASKAYVKDWIKSGNFDGNSVTVKAKMVVSSVGT